MRHGIGQVTYSDGKILVGTWNKDQLNGAARLKYPPFECRMNYTENLIYKDGIKFKNNSCGRLCNLTHFDILHAAFSSILMILNYGLIGNIESTSYLTIIIYILHLIHNICQKSTWLIFRKIAFCNLLIKLQTEVKIPP